MFAYQARNDIISIQIPCNLEGSRANECAQTTNHVPWHSWKLVSSSLQSRNVAQQVFGSSSSRRATMTHTVLKVALTRSAAGHQPITAGLQLTLPQSLGIPVHRFFCTLGQNTIPELALQST